MLMVRDLSAGPKRTTELLEDLHPISSRTLMGRLREMEQDELYTAQQLRRPAAARRIRTDRTRAQADSAAGGLMEAGLALECNECEDRRESAGYYCDFCPARVPSVEFTRSPNLSSQSNLSAEGRMTPSSCCRQSHS